MIDVHVTDLHTLHPDMDWAVASRPGCNDKVLMVDPSIDLVAYTTILTTVLTRVERACACYHYADGSEQGQSTDRKAG
jgi:hypothetical protein